MAALPSFREPLELLLLLRFCFGEGERDRDEEGLRLLRLLSFERFFVGLSPSLLPVASFCSVPLTASALLILAFSLSPGGGLGVLRHKLQDFS